MEWSKERNTSTSGEYIHHEIPKSWIHIHYYETLNILFRFENSLRVLVYSVLKVNKVNDWANTLINDTESIHNACKQRLEQNKKYGYLGQDTNSPMLYLNSGELIYIINNDKNWPLFKPYFSADRQIIVNKLLEINAIRNSFAHFRPITNEDVDLLKQNINHIFFRSYDYFNSLSNLYTVVPSNTVENWYTSLRELSYPSSKLLFHSSSDEHFVRISLRINLPEFDTRKYNSFAYVKSIAIDLPKFFKENKNLISQTIYIKDSFNILGNAVSHTLVVSSGSYVGFDFVFSRKNLNKESNEIISLFSNLCEQIESDVEVLVIDPHARGKFLLLETFYFSIEDNVWKKSTGTTRHDILKNNKLISAVEYWGEDGSVDLDYITKQHIVPWIPEPISEESFPF